MKQVIIEVKNGKIVKVASCPRKIQVVFKEVKKKSFKKQLKTGIYHIKSFMGIQ